jgi:hypothetical protein
LGGGVLVMAVLATFLHTEGVPVSRHLSGIGTNTKHARGCQHNAQRSISCMTVCPTTHSALMTAGLAAALLFRSSLSLPLAALVVAAAAALASSSFLRAALSRVAVACASCSSSACRRSETTCCQKCQDLTTTKRYCAQDIGEAQQCFNRLSGRSP